MTEVIAIETDQAWLLRIKSSDFGKYRYWEETKEELWLRAKVLLEKNMLLDSYNEITGNASFFGPTEIPKDVKDRLDELGTLEKDCGHPFPDGGW